MVLSSVNWQAATFELLKQRALPMLLEFIYPSFESDAAAAVIAADYDDDVRFVAFFFKYRYNFSA